MKISIIVFVFITVLYACQGKRPTIKDPIAGTYVRETSFEVKHPETGKEIGRSTLRDTLFIQESGAGFHIRQSKWRRNDFDQQGWHDQRHADQRPTPAYEATFDQHDGSLRPSESGWAVPLYVDAESSLLYQGSNRQHPYRKVP